MMLRNSMVKTNTLIIILCIILLVGNSFFPLIQAVQDDSETILLPQIEEQGSSEKSLVLPSSFSWRDINGVDFTTPIRNQAAVS